MKIAVTGHRPHKLGGYSPSNPLKKRIKEVMAKIIDLLKPEEVISGMALGVDQWWAEVALESGVPVYAAVPFVGQESRWPDSSKEHYRVLMQAATRVKVVCEGGYSAAKMQKRNEWMVDHADVILAIWDGSKGGTGNCVAYAQKQKKPLLIWNPKKPGSLKILFDSNDELRNQLKGGA